MSDRKPGLLIALSAGGLNSELAAHGIVIDQVEKLMAGMAMRLLGDGHRLSFGGTLGDPNRDLTKHLIETAERWLADKAAENVDVTKPETWPLVNYASWPNYKKITEEQRTRLVDICQFINIDPSGVSKEVLDSAIEPGVSKKHAANALSAMRDRSAEEADLRIVWGGRIQGASGWMAGILEEVACTLKLKKPLLVLGGFGGCARLIADFLHDPSAEWPKQLSLSASADSDRDALLTDDERQKLVDRVADAEILLKDFRSALLSNGSVNGLSSQLVRDLMLDEDTRSVINAAGAAVEACVV